MVVQPLPSRNYTQQKFEWKAASILINTCVCFLAAAKMFMPQNLEMGK
jgi:hypothetical protein